MQDGQHVILCIDDDQDVLMSLRIILESKGYRVVTAATAAEGIEVYKTHHPDLVIVDLMMEQIDAGMTLVGELKALGNTAPLYFLSSTGDYLYGTMDVGALGVSGVFQKPLDPDALLTLIRRKLGAPVA